MTKTIWTIKDVTDNTTTTLVYYHFLKNPNEKENQNEIDYLRLKYCGILNLSGTQKFF